MLNKAEQDEIIGLIKPNMMPASATLNALVSGQRLQNPIIGWQSLGIMGAQLRSPLKPLNTIVLWCTGGFSEPWIGPPWCREKLAFRSAARLVAVLFPVWVWARVHGVFNTNKKKGSDMKCSCPRDCRFSASWGTNWEPSWSPPNITTLWYRGVSGVGLSVD